MSGDVSRANGRFGGRPRLSDTNPWTSPIHYGDGVHLTCPDRPGAAAYDPGWPVCELHGKVRPMVVPLVDVSPRTLGRCGSCDGGAPTGDVVCVVCADDPDRGVSRSGLGPWLWGAPHPGDNVFAAIGDLP